MSSSKLSNALKILKKPMWKVILWTVPFGTLTATYTYCLPGTDIPDFMAFALPCLAAIVAGAGMVVKRPTSQRTKNRRSNIEEPRVTKFFDSALYILSYLLLLGAFLAYYLKSPLRTQAIFDIKFSFVAFFAAIAIEIVVMGAIWRIQLKKPFSSVSGIESFLSGALIFAIPVGVSFALLAIIDFLGRI